MEYSKITVTCSSSYDIIIGNGVLQSFNEFFSTACSKAKRILCVTDRHVDAIYGGMLDEMLASKYEYHKCIINGGEKDKSEVSVGVIYDMLMQESFTRDDVIVALGGGVVGDIAGFCASTYQRGIGFVQVPTTIIAQTDSSVGGKTAINYGGKKNVIGSFYQPRLVVIDTDTLKSLPSREYRCGMAEIIKYACIADAEMFEMLADNADYDFSEIVYRCVSLKKQFVENDEFDRGERRLLNFGHTVGHALEAASCNEILHGEAVALGMLAAVRIGNALSVTPEYVYDELKTLLETYGLETSVPKELKDKFKEFVLADKKRSGNDITVVLLEDIGKTTLMTIPFNELEKVL